jgi:class 3 adenylate cyclase
MDERDRKKIIEFPVHRRGSLADTMSGFPDREDGPPTEATRREQALSLVVAEMRGFAAVVSRLGVTAADAAVEAAVATAVDVLRSFGGEQVAVGGTSAQPVVWAEFGGDAHAATAVTAGASVRDALDGDVRPSIGINSGLVVDTTVGGAVPVAYRAMGTLRMFAVRLQEFAGPGDIYAAEATVSALSPNTATFRRVGPVRTNAGGETSEAFALVELVTPARSAGSA